jgi:serine/threonine-protein kinase
MGEVHKTVDTKSGRYVALKMAPVPVYPADSPKYLRRERTALSKVHHRNIVRLLDEGTDGTNPFIVMELMDGQTLNKLIDEYGALPWPIAKPIIIQLCDALQAVHEANMVHSDVNPKNVFLSGNVSNPTVKLFDFGLVRFTDAKDGDKERAEQGPDGERCIKGTPIYMAPEQVVERTADTYDHLADVHAVGILMYETLTGINPFNYASTVLAVFHSILNDVPISLRLSVPDIPSTVDAIVKKALAKKPEDRFQSMAEMREAIRFCR